MEVWVPVRCFIRHLIGPFQSMRSGWVNHVKKYIGFSHIPVVRTDQTPNRVMSDEGCC